ncbi:putative gtpase binding protein rid1 [Erysiphe neolycopersici]|uniref:Putative gtpase binding protein rid1 n=1 Tax=Erysiphe neolycopersici TaxID=212602 RepID=A0A420I1R3_9PEZI|nr:putative gtpase binding protein rid1 [Erysiphe neolycopersici]
MAYQKSTAESHQHRRLKSSVLSNISLIHKRTPSSGLSHRENVNNKNSHPKFEATPYFSSQRPHSMVLEECHYNQQDQQESTRSVIVETANKTLKKKSKSSLSLKSLSRKEGGMEGHKASGFKQSKPTKTKSSSNFTNLLSRPKSLMNLKKEANEDYLNGQRNKENNYPQKSPKKPQTPIHAEFSSQQYTFKVKNEINLYTPKDYTPRKQRDFFEDGNRPTLGKRTESQPRPKSTYLPSSFSIQDISRRVSGGSRHSAELIRRVSGRKQNSERKASSTTVKPDKVEKSNQNYGQRVLTAVSSSFSSKVPSIPNSQSENSHNDDEINKEFEALLDRRNIPDHQRGKMRCLAMSMKKDFIKQDWAEIAALENSKQDENSSDADRSFILTETTDTTEVKSKRPRSRTFTLSINVGKNINNKSTKPEATAIKNLKKKSTESLNGGLKIFNGAGVISAQNIIAKAKGQTPDDFVSYMIRVPKPEKVEVGRLHKLRLLLRNETVAWTDNFIRQGGMEEIVSLLHRTIAIEWREEHEDALLHEVLLCLKGLSTTALALKCLDNMQATLFPSLLGMLFDEEKKGPSEFTTRNIITSLLFTYLKSAPNSEREKRAKIVLSYLRDPEPSESQRPIGFVLEMRQPRPYRVWCKEVVNVTKEVFWIFLHNLNVIALPESVPIIKDSTKETTISTPSITSRESLDVTTFSYSYMSKHFPQERAPIPAAPYVGGVEWDATNYLASHLDLVNGILASLSSSEERNQLREQMLVSGWEKCMGGTLRLCKEKFYGNVHAGLTCWVAAASDDGWNTSFVRCGPCTENEKILPKKIPQKNLIPPKIALDFLETDKKSNEDSTNWL